MHLKRYECFLAVARELHFGRAAARMHMSQPPLSLQIRALEKELGVKLFERTSKAVSLTPAGEALLPEARNVLDCARRAVEAARLADRGEAGLLNVGFVNPAMDGPLSAAVKEFRRHRPLFTLSLREMTSSAQLAELRAGSLQLGFLRHGWLDFTGLESVVVARDRYVLALPEGHPLSGGGPIPIKSLDGVPLVFYPRHAQPRLHDAMISALHEGGVTPRIVQEAISKHTTLSLVATGMGGALVPASSKVWRRVGVCFREIEGKLPAVEIAAVWPRRTHPAALELVEKAREQQPAPID